MPHELPLVGNPLYFSIYIYIYIYIFHCIASDFSDLPDMILPDDYIDLSVYALTGLLLYILYLTYIQR